MESPSAEECARLSERKRVLRAQLKAARDATPANMRAQADAEIADRVLALSAWQAAETLLAYLAFGSEVETRPLIEAAWSAGKRVLLPRVGPAPGEMRWYEVGEFAMLEPGAHGILEPAEGWAEPADPYATPASLCIVPGLGFDIAGFRIGYGGGYYDRFLYDFPGTSAGLVRSAQLLDWIDCVEAHDRAVDVVVCESRTI